MYISIDEYKAKIEQFNTKYGVSFSYEMIKSYVGDSKSLERGDAYNKIGLKLAKEACQQHLMSKMKKGEVDNFSDSILIDFEDMIMQPHVDSSANINDYVAYNLEFSGNKTKRYEFIKDALKDAPKNLADVYQREYQSGKLPIRQMRQFIEGIDVQNLSEEQVLTALNYSRALSQAYKERSIFSMILHPIRSYAENKYVKQFTNDIYSMLKERSNEANTQFKQVSEYINMVKAPAKGLESSIKNLDEVIEANANEELSFAIDDEEYVEYKEIDVKDIPKEKRLANSKLMEAKYIPDIANLHKEAEELLKIQRFINEDANLKNYPYEPYISALKKIVDENIERCNTVKEAFDSKGEEAAKNVIQEQKNEIWDYTTVMNTNMLNNARSYVEVGFIEPKIIIDKSQEELALQDQRIDERVNISVDINESKIDGISERQVDNNLSKSKDVIVGKNN